MKLIDYHRSFLVNTVNLNQTRLDLLQSRVESIYVAAAMDPILGPFVEEYVPQGSWAHGTIIRPVGNREFDADILLKITERPEWAGDKKKYVTETLAAFDRAAYAGKTEKHTRCVRIIYADDCHVDIVPYGELEDGRQVIIDTKANEFESSNPQGFTDWMKEKDDLTGGNLRKVIRLLKHLRDYKTTFSVPSVILTTLVGERVLVWNAEGRYPDVPTALKNILADLDSWLQMYETMPSIADPSCPDVNFDHRWDQARYTTFRKKIHDYSAWVTEAYDEPVKDKSVGLWQKVFGPDFKAPAAAAALPTVTKSASLVPYVRAPKEQFIEDRGFGYNLTHKATITPRWRGALGSGTATCERWDRLARGDRSTSAFAPMSRRRTPCSGRSATSAQRRLLWASCAGSSKTGPRPTRSERAPPTRERTGSSATSSRTASCGRLIATWSGSADGRAAGPPPERSRCGHELPRAPARVVRWL